jgi:hypothetical protein
MTPKERQEIEAHLNAVAKILYKNTNPEQLKDFESIELVTREHLLTEIGPKLGEFFLMQESHSPPHGANK